MKKHLTFKIHNPNSEAITAEYLLPLLLKANMEKTAFTYRRENP